MAKAALTDFEITVLSMIRIHSSHGSGLLAQELEQDLLGIEDPDPDFGKVYGSYDDIREALLVLESRGLIGFDLDMGWKINR